MPIRHLLYACVECGREGGIQPTKDGEVCDRCATRYTRAEGSMIRCERPGRETEVKHPADWLNYLHTHSEKGATRRPAPVTLRIAPRQKPYRHSDVLLGFIEEFDPPEDGTIELGEDSINFKSAAGERRWPLDELTAVQPTSGTLNLKLRKGPLVAIRFRDGSPLLWEERVKAAIQKRFSASGRGEIAEFQPRIVCR